MSGSSDWSAPGGAPAPGGDPMAPPPVGSYGQVPPGPQGFAAPPGWGGPASPQPWGAPRPPDVRPGVVPLRPLGLGELLDGAVSVVRRYPRPVLGLAAVVALVSTVLNALLLVTALGPVLDLDPSAFEDGDLAELEGALGGAAVGVGASGLVSLLTGVVLAGVITAVVGKAVLGQPATLGGAWAQVRPLLARLVGLALLVLLLVAGTVIGGVAVGATLIAVGGAPLALVGVPLVLGGIALAVYLYVRLSLAPCVLVLERSGVRESLRRSGVLVKGSWWRVTGILLLVFVISQFVATIVQLPFQAVGLAPGLGGFEEVTTTELVLSSIGSGIALTIVAPFTAGVRALLYVDRRMRAEGLDVALAAAAAAPRDGA